MYFRGVVADREDDQTGTQKGKATQFKIVFDSQLDCLVGQHSRLDFRIHIAFRQVQAAVQERR